MSKDKKNNSCTQSPRTKEINLNDFPFDLHIPALLALDREIEPNAVRLYAFIRGLTKAHGYCYATNSYLMNLMDMDERSVRRLLASLVEKGYLKTETNKNGVHWQRRIYLSEGFKKCLGEDKIAPPPGQNCPP